jgi:hypothetical protein
MENMVVTAKSVTANKVYNQGGKAMGVVGERVKSKISEQ